MKINQEFDWEDKIYLLLLKNNLIKNMHRLKHYMFLAKF